MWRTVAEDTPSPAAVTSTDEATGWPEAIYSRTSVARTRPDRSSGSISTRKLRLPMKLYTSVGARWRGLQTCARDQIARRRARLADNLRAVHSNRHALIDQHVAVDDGRGDIAAAGGIDEHGKRVDAGCEVRPLPVDDDEVGTLARFDRADFGFEAQRPGAAASRHPEHLARRQHAGAVTNGLKDRRQAHFLEHVEAVVAGSAVRGQR